MRESVYPCVLQRGWRSSALLLEDPGVSVGVAEVGERVVVRVVGVRSGLPLARYEMANLADIDPSFTELRTRRFDVGDDEMNASHGAWCRIGDALSDCDRARRSRWCHLNDSELLRGRMVDVQVEAGLFGIKGLGSVDVGNGQQQELELVIHAEASLSLKVGCSVDRSARGFAGRRDRGRNAPSR